MKLARLFLLLFGIGFITATTATEADAQWPWGQSVYQWGGLTAGHWGFGAGWVPSVVPNIPSPNSFDVYPPPYYSYRGVALSPYVGPAFGRSPYGYPATGGYSQVGFGGQGSTPSNYEATAYSPYGYPAFRITSARSYRPRVSAYDHAPQEPEPEPAWIINEFAERAPAEGAVAPEEGETASKDAKPADLAVIFEGSMPAK